MRILLDRFVTFLKHPIILESDVLSIKESVILLFKSVVLYAIFTLSYVVLVAILYFVLNLNITEFGSKTSNILYIVITAPIIEELIFRLPLKKFSKNIFISIGLLAYVFINDHLHVLMAIFLGMAIAFFPYLPFFGKKLELRINSFFKKHYGYIFYFFGFLFGLVHLYNAELFTLDMFLSAFIYVINPLIFGYYLAFIRVCFKFGIIYAIILHSIGNLLLIIPTLF